MEKEYGPENAGVSFSAAISDLTLSPTDFRVAKPFYTLRNSLIIVYSRHLKNSLFSPIF
jgi:hypothetical protein